MRIAIVGSGISGLACAWLLSRKHEVTLYEADRRLGGHTHTHEIEIDHQPVRIDTGFIVFNPEHYPLLTALFRELGISSKPTEMSFSVQNARTGLEYSASKLDGLFCQRKNLVTPNFLRMLADIRRFYRAAPALLESASIDLRLGDFLSAQGYSAMFRDDHLVPMASALWSSSSAQILEFPLVHLLRFMANHEMLRLVGRPQWRVVDGGSNRYVEAMQKQWRVQVRLNSPVVAVSRGPDRATVATADGSDTFDQVVLACHSDQALAMLTDPSDAEQSILGAVRYQTNDVALHTDARLMPKSRKAWAAWNAYVPATFEQGCTVSYCMNILQSLDVSMPVIVSLNRTADIDPAKILYRGRYDHPLQTVESACAQQRKAEIQGMRNTWFAGAYWGFAFHEDGMRSGVDVANRLGVAWP